MPATTLFSESLIECDISELKVPEYIDDDLVLLRANHVTGSVESLRNKVAFAAEIREKKLKEWSPDLSPHIVSALRGMPDAMWWIANQYKDSSNIGWPISWVAATRNQARPPEPGPPSSVNKARNRVLESKLEDELENFEAFALKVCKSPEMSYLTMLALVYRQTKHPKILSKFIEARQKVSGYLDGIDKILGSPGQ